MLSGEILGRRIFRFVLATGTSIQVQGKRDHEDEQ